MKNSTTNISNLVWYFATYKVEQSGTVDERSFYTFGDNIIDAAAKGAFGLSRNDVSIEKISCLDIRPVNEDESEQLNDEIRDHKAAPEAREGDLE